MNPNVKRLLEAIAIVAVCGLLLVRAAAAQAQLTQEYGSISGKILAKNGTPAVGVRVAAMDTRDNPTAREAALLSVVQTDAQGQYRLERVPVGRYYITAGFLDTPTYFPGVAVQTQANVVEVTRGASLTGKDFSIVFLTAVSVRGSVIREEKFISASQKSVSFNAGFGSTNSASVAPDGSFQINLRPGVYTVNVGSSCVIPSTLTVLDRDITDLRLEVPSVASVSGTLTNVTEGILIEAVDLRGHSQISSATIRGGIHSRPGDCSSLAVIKSDIEFLYSLGFEEVRVEEQPGRIGKTILFQLKEKATP